MTDDLFRVIYTDLDGEDYWDAEPTTRDEALSFFDSVMADGGIATDTRLRVMSDHEWCKVRPLPAERA